MANTVITGPILDSFGQPANGYLYGRQSARMEIDGALVTQTVTKARVIDGVPFLDDGVTPLSVAPTVEGEYFEIVEDFRNYDGQLVRKVTIPESGPVAYSSLVDQIVPVSSSIAIVPGWYRDMAGVADEAIAAKNAAEAAAAAAQESAEAVPVAVAEAVTATDIPGQVTVAVADAAEGLDIALRDDFATTDQGASFAFPESTVLVPNGTFTKNDVIDATALPASTSLNGTTTSGSVGGKAVATSTSGTPVFTTDAGQTGFKITSGTGSASFTDAVNQVVFKVASLPAFGTGTARGMAVYVCSNITTTSYLFGMILSSGGNYQIGFFGGTINNDNWDFAGSNSGAAVGWTGIESHNQAAAVGDVGVIAFDPATSILSLTVNGTLLVKGTLSPTQVGRMGSRVGVWGRAGATQIPSFEWVGAATENTTPVERRMVTSDPSNNLPTGVLAKIESYLNSRSQTGALYDIRRYGAKCDGILLKDGAMTSGSNVLTSASRTFTMADVGKRIGVIGAQPVVANVNSNGVLNASISSVASGSAILSIAATATVTGAEVIFGTNDDAAIVAARDAAAAAGGGTVLFPVGKTIVNATHTAIDNVSYAGADRNGSEVYPVKTKDYAQPVGQPMTGPWLYAWTVSAENPAQQEYLRNVDVHDFTVQCRFWAAETIFSTRLKPLSFANMYNSQVYRMNVIDSPATAIPWDGSVASAIHHNRIINPGRLFPTSSAGGSGVGVGTGLKGIGSEWIAFNTIISTQTASTKGYGNHGIFVEAQSNMTDPNSTLVEPLNIIANTIVGMPFGITDAGAMGSIIADNQLVRCGVGIAVRPTNLSSSYPGLNVSIHHNVIRDSAGPDTLEGIGILVRTDTGHTLSSSAINALIESNTIIRSAKYGIRLLSSSVGIDGVRVTDNTIRDSGLSAIRVGGLPAFRMLVIRDNDLHANGKLGTSGDRAGILVDSGATWTGGRIQDNDIYDLQGSPTQVDVIVTTGATLTSVRRSGNTGDA